MSELVAGRSDLGKQQTVRPRPRTRDQVPPLLKIAMLLRLFALLASLVGFVSTRLTFVQVLAIIFLAATSMVVLAVPRATTVVQRFPVLVGMDALIVAALMFAVGVDNPLVLTSLSSAAVIGVALSRVPAAISTLILITGYLIAAFQTAPAQAQTGFTTRLAVPIMYVSLVALCYGFRRAGEAQRAAERAFVGAVSSASAAEERSRLARELHDSTAKTLQGLALGARSLPIWIEREPERAKEDARLLADAADEAVLQIRHLLTVMRQDIHDQPFAEMLGTVCTDFQQDSGIRVRCSATQVELSDPSVRYELLACVREALMNVRDHANATMVEVRLAEAADEATVTVSDNGRGFDPAIIPDRERAGHFGIRGFTERMSTIGGDAAVTTTVGKGTVVSMRAPLMGLREREGAA